MARCPIYYGSRGLGSVSHRGSGHTSRPPPTCSPVTSPRAARTSGGRPSRRPCSSSGRRCSRRSVLLEVVEVEEVSA
eukprot:4533300-Heterocapsa_arctica.AAC.1